MIIFITLLILSVILINGWTDAPNAIAGCVSTRSLSPRAAVALAAVCNLVGAIGMSLISPRVAVTLYNIVDLGDSKDSALCAVCAGLLSVVVWSVAAWRFGLPTSESHALIAGLTAGYTTKGVQSYPGIGVTLKHYAVNSQESARNSENNTGRTR